MSYEFGDSGQCFFHEHIGHALEDAKSGSTDGAKLMATILEPLASIAHHVSAEEAGDSGETGVVQAISDAIESINQAVSAMTWYVDPAREMTARAIAEMLKDKAIVKINDKSGTVELSKEHAIKGVPLGVERKIISILSGGMSVNGCMSSEGTITYFVNHWRSR